MNNVVLLLTCVFEVYVVYRFMAVFFDNRKTGIKTTVAIYVFRCITGYIIVITETYPIINAVSSVAGLFLITLCYEASLSKKIVTTVIIYMCMFLTEAVMALLTGVSNVGLLNKVKDIDAVISIIIEIILWVITLILQKLRNIRTYKSVPKAFIAAMIIVFTTSFCMETLVFQQVNVNDSISAISLICVLIMNFIMIYLYDSLSGMFEERTKAEIILRENACYHKQSELLQRNYEELEQFRHDINNRLLVIKQMVDSNETEKISEYLYGITEKIENTELYSQTGNLAIDSIINYKLGKAHNSGIEVESNIVIPAEMNINDDDMVVILGNLFDNAIEATERLDSYKKISVNLEYEKSCTFIKIKNSYDNVINMVNGRIATRKRNSTMHGIGLRSVQTAIDKYDGIMDIEHNNNEFIVNVILYI